MGLIAAHPEVGEVGGLAEPPVSDLRHLDGAEVVAVVAVVVDAGAFAVSSKVVMARRPGQSAAGTS